MDKKTLINLFLIILFYFILVFIFYFSSNKIHSQSKLESYYDEKAIFINNIDTEKPQQQIIQKLPAELLDIDSYHKDANHVENAHIDHINKITLISRESIITPNLEKDRLSFIDPSKVTPSPKKQIFRVHEVKHIFSTSFMLDLSYMNIDSQNKLKKLKILVYKERFEENTLKASNGGPAGELIMFKSLLCMIYISIIFKF